MRLQRLARGDVTTLPGEVIRTPPGEVHGLTNTGAELFSHLTATGSAIDLTTVYQTSSDRS